MSVRETQKEDPNPHDFHLRLRFSIRAALPFTFYFITLF